jgi:hypothetical protein
VSALGLIAHGAVSLAFGYFVVSLVANAIHRWPSHDKRWKGAVWPFGEIFRRHILHHQAFPGFDSPAHDDETLYALDIDARVTAAMVALMAAPLALVDPLTAAAMAGAIVLHNHIYNVVHREMHAPAGRWFAGSSLYRYYVWYHFLHHRHPRTRFDSAFPLADWLLGTLGTATEADRRLFEAMATAGPRRAEPAVGV